MVLLSPLTSTDYGRLPLSLIEVSPRFYQNAYDAWKDFFREVCNTYCPYDILVTNHPVASFNMPSLIQEIPRYFRISSTFEEDIGTRDIRDAYRSLFYKIACHPSVDSIDILSGIDWITKYIRFLEESPVDYGEEHGKIVGMVDTASMRRNKFHYLKSTFSDRTGKSDRASMDFTQIDNKIVGYALRIPKEFAQFFDISSSTDSWTHAYGLWVPKALD